MKIQKFKHGDKVKVAKNLGSTMAHFRNDFEAIVMYSYASKYGVDHDGNYGIMACDTGNECAWYNENQLTLIEHVGQKGIDIIKERKEEKEKQESNMDWIWDNWKEIRTAVPGATMCELMKRIGITEPWGSRGEGVTYYNNVQKTFKLLDPILLAGNIEAFKKVTEDEKIG